jgi:hypothetical protein
MAGATSPALQFASAAPLRGGPIRGATLARLVQHLITALFDPYRPELHYMRGPGPKWREKHGRTANRSPRSH